VFRGYDKIRAEKGVPLQQKDVEMQAELTKDRGEYYIELAKKLE
jgi:hypothetical protein